MHDSKKTKVQLVKEIKVLQKEVSSQQTLLQSALLQSGVVASALDVIIVIDKAQNILQFNNAAEQVFGYTAAEILGKPIHILLPERFRDNHHKHIQNFGETEVTSQTMHSITTVTGLRANGESFPIEASISQTMVGDKKYYAVILRDISERENLESLILRQYDALNTLHLVTLDLLNRRDITNLLQFIVDEAVKLLEVSYCEIVLPDGDELVVQAFTRGSPFAGGNRFTRAEGHLSWQVFDSGLPAVLDDYSTWERRHKIYESENFHAAAVLPLLVENQTIGVLGMTRDKPGYKFTEEQILTATRLAAIAALAIENSRLLLEVRRLATTDELTGAHNRRSLLDIGESELRRAVRYDRVLSALMLDVDHFKRVNDTWGHQTGDVVLRGVVQESMNQIRKTDAIGRYAEPHNGTENVIGRFGGEEFGILLPETPLEGALIVAERIRSSIEKMIFNPVGATKSNKNPGAKIQVTVSVGVSCLLSKTDVFAELIARADRALYTAKESGRNRVCMIARNK
jgi:PAS domain S-box-containing protein